MKILIDSYSTCMQNDSGGVQIRIKKIMELLKEKNIIVDYFNKFSTKLTDYDILHIFSLNIENYTLIKYAKEIGLKVIISTVIPIKYGMKIDFYRHIRKLPIPTTYRILYNSLQLADKIIVETPREATFISEHYKIQSRKVIIIPNGIEETQKGNKEIYDLLGKEYKYILQVGRFDKNKNQLNIIKALKDTYLDVVFIGGPKNGDKTYYKKCIEEAQGYDNFHFLGWIDNKSPILKSAYTNAELVVMPSYSETFGLVILEAGISGTKIAVSSTLPILDYKALDGCYSFSPYKIKDIKETILKAVKEEKNENLKINIKKFFTWDNVIKKHIDCYKEVKDEKNSNKHI